MSLWLCSLTWANTSTCSKLSLCHGRAVGVKAARLNVHGMGPDGDDFAGGGGQLFAQQHECGNSGCYQNGSNDGGYDYMAGSLGEFLTAGCVVDLLGES